MTGTLGGRETSGRPRPTHVLVQPVGVLVGDGGTLLDVRVAQDLVGSLVGTGLDFGGLRLSGHGCSSFFVGYAIRVKSISLVEVGWQKEDRN